MQRLNLNVPAEARAALKRLAKRDGRREAEVARELLLRAIEEAERDEFFRELEASRTPALRERLQRIGRALETLHGRAR